MTADTPEQNAGRAPEAETPVAANDAEPPAKQSETADPAAGPGPEQAGMAQEVAELKDRLLRAMADSENTRRRAAREVEDARKFAVSGMARDLLAVADNLRRALEAVPEAAREQQAELNNLVAGVELTERELQKAFEKAGIVPVNPVGQKLDPNLHQAMMQVPDPNAEPGTVVQVVQIGYTLNDRLLRPALVGVAAAPAGGPGGGSGGEPGGKVDQQA